MLTQEQIRALMGSLNPNRVASRNQSGRDLSYLEAFDVKATLIRIFGFGNFDAETIETRILREHSFIPDGQQRERFVITALCTVRLGIHATGATYTESSVASQSGPDHGEVCDFAVKTAESDALKRAATYLGTQFGLSLYDSGSTREIVRVLFEPTQRDLLAATAAPVSADAATVLQNSLGATVIEQEAAEPDTDFGGRQANDPEPESMATVTDVPTGDRV